jgi:PAS domain S-box-containing protein
MGKRSDMRMRAAKPGTKRPGRIGVGGQAGSDGATPASKAETATGGGLAEIEGLGAVLSDPDSLLDTLLANSPDMIYFKDRQSRFVHSSASFCHHFGLASPELLRGKTDFDLFNKNHAQPAFEDEQEILRTGRPIIAKLERETYPDGRVTWALTDKMPWRDKRGRIIGTFGISKDVTALKKAEERLAREHELLCTLMDNVPDSIYFKDCQSRFVHVGRATLLKVLQSAPELKARLARSGGASGAVESSPDPESLVGLTDFDTFTEEHARQAFEDEQEIIRTGRPVIGKPERETHLDGSVTWCLTTKMPWRDKDGNIIGTFGISRDITALKQAEAELAAAHKRLIETSRLAGMAEVATDVLHNVGNTLNSINVSCSLVLDRVKQTSSANLAKIPELLKQNLGRLDEFVGGDPRGKHIPEYLTAMAQTFDDQRAFLLEELGQLRQHVEHVNQIIAMQQNYAKVAGIQETIDLSQLLEDALQINAAALERHGIEVRREIEPVPAVLVDKHKILQILVNLIRNAKYAVSEAARPDKLMILRLARDGRDRLLIQVIDNGVGIAPENLTRIFSHGFTTRRDGHGFGLHSGALAARDLGGSLAARSEGVGRGATFTLTLPLKANPNT